MLFPIRRDSTPNHSTVMVRSLEFVMTARDSYGWNLQSAHISYRFNLRNRYTSLPFAWKISPSLLFYMSKLFRMISLFSLYSISFFQENVFSNLKQRIDLERNSFCLQ